jgi:hypothetical protein
VKGKIMRKTYLGGLVLSGVAVAFVAFNGCSTNTTRKPITTGAAGQADTSGAAGTPASSGAAGDSSAAGTTGAAGDTSGAAGADTGAAGITADASTTPDTSVAGTSGAAGDTSGLAGAGAAGATVDTSPTIPLPIAITADWYPSGWSGDTYTVATFTANAASVITIAVATDGPCAARVAGPVGNCYKVTYTPAIAPDGGVPGYAAVALLGNEPGTVNTPDYSDVLGAPRPAQGGRMITAEVAGAVGGETVSFNLGVDNTGNNMQFTPTLTTSWQQLSYPLTGVTYDHVLTPFGWSSTSATPITFYYDDLSFQ